MQFNELTSAQKEVLGQLFLYGPTWDGNIASKSARDDLFDYGLAFRREGFASLTPDGLEMAAKAEVKTWFHGKWHQKQER